MPQPAELHPCGVTRLLEDLPEGVAKFLLSGRREMVAEQRAVHCSSGLHGPLQGGVTRGRHENLGQPRVLQPSRTEAQHSSLLSQWPHGKEEEQKVSDQRTRSRTAVHQACMGRHSSPEASLLRRQPAGMPGGGIGRVVSVIRAYSVPQACCFLPTACGMPVNTPSTPCARRTP